MNSFKDFNQKIEFFKNFFIDFGTWYAAFGIVTPVARELQIWKDAGPTMRSWHVLKTNYKIHTTNGNSFRVGFLRILDWLMCGKFVL